VYTYNILINRWIDGDSVNVDIDLGFNIIIKNQVIRLKGIDTPELRPRYADYTQADGSIDESARNEKIHQAKIALEFVKSIAPEGMTFIGTTSKANPDSFGRWLLNFKINDKLISEHIIDAGFSD